MYKIDIISLIILPSLFETARKVEYGNKKYYSSLI